MIEMLGVLAIIGVLSVGGIAGYSKAMMQYKINKTVDQITHIVGNIRTLYANQKNYSSVYSRTIWKKGHLIPEEMWSGSDVENPFGGSVGIMSAYRQGSYNKAFEVYLSSVPEEACMALATYDWGSGSSSGLLAVGVNYGTSGDMSNYGSSYSNGDYTSGKAFAVPNGATVSVPIPVNIAANACHEGDDNYVHFVFY